jgi:fatty-acyl-CoA synthase
MRARGINYEILGPLSFLRRSLLVNGHEEAVVYRDKRYTYSEFLSRVFRLASALMDAGIGEGDKVVFICPNSPPLLEAHFAVPMIGAVLVGINIRFSPEEVARIMKHSDPKALFVDSEFAPLVSSCLDDHANLRTIVNICDTSEERPFEGPEYEEFLFEHRTRMC